MKKKTWVILLIVVAVIVSILFIFKPRIKPKKQISTPYNGGDATDATPIVAPNTNIADAVKDIADAINAFTNNLIDFTSQYKGKSINYWVQQIAYLSPEAIIQLDNYWNSKYFQSNGAYSINVLIVDIELGGERTIINALNNLKCGVQGFDCTIKDIAITNLKNNVNA